MSLHCQWLFVLCPVSTRYGMAELRAHVPECREIRVPVLWPPAVIVIRPSSQNEVVRTIGPGNHGAGACRYLRLTPDDQMEKPAGLPPRSIRACRRAVVAPLRHQQTAESDNWHPRWGGKI